MSTTPANPHLPVPKVYLPAVVGAIAIVIHFLATGEFDRSEAAAALALALYAAVGYVSPRA